MNRGRSASVTKDSEPATPRVPAAGTAGEGPAAPEQRIDRRAVALFAIPMGILTVMGMLGDALAPTLLQRAPLLLLVCNPRLRNLVLVSPTVDVVPFAAIAIGRLVVSDPLFFHFGRRYGDVAVRWMERRLGPSAGMVLWGERLFRKAAYPVLAVMPNNMICLLAGATSISWAAFLALNLGGTIVRVAAIRWLGSAFSDPILAINDWIGEHRLVLTAITFGTVFVVALRRGLQGRGEIETPGDLADELTEELAELAEEAGTAADASAPPGRDATTADEEPGPTGGGVS